jgi:hypothetical protein
VPRGVCPRDRLRPLELRLRPGRAVVEALVLLAPVALIAEPRIGAQVLRLAGRNQRDLRCSSVEGPLVSSQPTPWQRSGRGAAPRCSSSRAIRAPGRRPDECRRPPGASGHPLRALCALMLAQGQERGLQMQRLRRRGGVEVELDHLPVAFVLDRCSRRRPQTRGSPGDSRTIPSRDPARSARPW